MAKLSRVDENKLNQVLENLREAVKKSNRKEIVNILKQLIPSYQPNDTNNLN